MRQYLFILFYLFICGNTTAQTTIAKLDSLNKVYHAATYDTVKIQVLLDAVEIQLAQKNDTTKLLLDKVIKLSSKVNYTKGLIKAYSSLGAFYFNKNQYNEAIIWLKKALDLALKEGGVEQTIRPYSILGQIYDNQGNYPEAFSCYHNLLQKAEILKDDLVIARTLNSISVIHGKQGNYDLAKDYNWRSSVISRKKGLKSILASSMSNLGVIYAIHLKYDSALFYFKESAVLKEQMDSDSDARSLCISYMNIAGVYREQKNFINALIYLDKAKEINQKVNLSTIEIAILRNKTTLFIALEDYEKCVEVGELGLQKAKEMKLLSEVKDFSENLSIAYYNLGIFKKAYNYQKEAQIAQDSLFSITKEKSIMNLESKIELTRKEKELALVEKDNELNRIASERKDQELKIVSQQAETERLLALAMQEKDKRKADSLFNLAKQSKMKAENLQIQQEKQDLAFRAEREEQKRIQNTYLGIAGTFLIILVLIAIGLRQKQKANKKLAMQQKEIAEKNDFLNQANEELQQQHEELIVLHENLDTQKQTIEKTYIQLKTTTEQLDKSIQYASHIQTVVMTEDAELRHFFSDLFILFRPKDVVSGDFYWFSQISENQAIFSLADCTGHGVPGAFMSMLGATLLHETINIKKITEDPARILKNVHQAIRKILKQEQDKNNDGMDISICVFTKKPQENSVELIFSGAKSSMSYITNGEIHHIKGDKQYLGGEKLKQDFTNQYFTLPSETIFYLYTDGYADQNNPERKKVGSGAFRELLLNNSTEKFDTQQKQLENFLDNHQKNAEQRDDISVIAIKV